jgi:hypothetical protein
MFESDSYDPQVIYREVQDFNHPFIWILMGAIDAIILGNIFIAHNLNNKLPAQKYGSELSGISFAIFAALMIIFLLILNWFFFTLKLITEIRNDCLIIHLRTGFKRRIEYGDISKIETVAQSRFFRGGWGYHVAPGWRCYSAPGGGETVIRLTLRNNLKIVLSSKEPETIAKMIRDTARAYGVDLQH